MHISSVILGLAAVATTSFVNAANSLGYVPVPWDGRAYNLTMETLESKYVTSLLTQRSTGNRKIADYLTIQRQFRPEGYNDDDGAIALGVDGNSIFNDNTDARQSELLQLIEGSADGTTFYRASLKKGDDFLNRYKWQLISVGGLCSIGVDASVDPPLIFLHANGTADHAWSATFVAGTWYNFGIGIEKTADGNNMNLEFYTSTGQDELVFNKATELPGSLLTLNEFYIGPYTSTSDGSEPKMNAQQDVVSFNGISVEATPINAGAPTPAPSEGGTAVVTDGSSSSSSP